MEPSARVSLKHFLGVLFKVRKGEFSKTFLMGLYAFNCVAAITVGRVLGSVLFLSHVPLTRMPLIYILVALIVGGSSFLFSKRFSRMGLKTGMNLVLGGVLLLLFLFRWLIELPYADTLFIPAFSVFVECMVVILMVQFWSFANELFNAREAKRLFGVIGGGQMLANLYNFPIKALKDVIGINNLIFVCAASILACIVIVNYLFARHSHTLVARSKVRSRIVSGTTGKGRDVQEGTQAFWRLRATILLMTAVTMLTVTLVDYQFRVNACHVYQGEALADYFFSVYAYTGILSSFFQFFLTTRILESFGILYSLFILPFSLATGSLLALAGLGSTGVTITRCGELVTRYTINETTTQILYQPLPTTQRRRTKTLADGFARPLAQASGGVLCLILSYLYQIEQADRILTLSAVIVGLVGLWAFVAWRLRASYVSALLVASRRQGSGEGARVDEDEPSREITQLALQRALISNDSSQVLGALDVLPRGVMTARLEPLVAPLVTAQDPRVRDAAISYLGSLGNRKYAKNFLPLFDDPDPKVAASAIRAYAYLERERALSLLKRPLSAKAPEIKAATIAGLIEYGGLSGIMEATGVLDAMLKNPEASERENGARVLGYIKIRSFYQPLFALINDPDPKVKLAAIAAAGEIKSRELVPTLILVLGGEGPRVKAAQKALAQMGNDVAPLLAMVLGMPSLPPRIRNAVPGVLALIQTPQAYEAIESQLAISDARLRGAVLRALQKLVLRLDNEITPDFVRIRLALLAEFNLYYQLLLECETLKAAPNAAAGLLLAALEDRTQDTLERIFSLLSVLFPREQIELVSYNMKSENPTSRANASEIVDNICDNEIKRVLLPILDNTDRADKATEGAKLFKLRVETAPKLYARYIFAEDDAWVAACAWHAATKAQAFELAHHLPRFAEHPEAVVRECVLFAAQTLLTPADRQQLLARYDREHDPVVLAYLRTCQDTP